MFASNYNLREKIDFAIFRIIGHSHRYKKHFKDALNRKKVFSKAKKPIVFAFTGDVMPIGERSLKLSAEIKSFLKGVDYLVINLEGIIYEKRRFLALSHNKRIIEDIKNIPVKNIIINCSNNHAADFGDEAFEQSCRLLEREGFIVMGHKEESCTKQINNINLNVVTFWSNQKNSCVSKLDKDDAKSIHLINKYLKEKHFNILFPHWGYEMHLYPSPTQVKLGNSLLQHWDLIIGNHPHCPQPVQQYKNKIIAYSHGNFCCEWKRRIFTKGMLSKVVIDQENLELAEFDFILTEYVVHEDNIAVNSR